MWYFVDEAGDATFFNRHGEYIVGQPGCSTILLLGFAQMCDPYIARGALEDLRSQLLGDPYLKNIPSMNKTAVAFHAKDDCAEVRQAVYKLIESLDFESQFIVARKRRDTFLRTFKGKPHKFYDHLVAHLFSNVLHRAKRNHVYFAKRGDRDRQAPFESAIRNGVAKFEEKWKTTVDVEVTVQAQTPSGEPCLQIIDYVIWAIQRAFVKREMRYFDYVREKIALVVDLYDTERYPKNFYDRERNPFLIDNVSPL